MSYTVPQIAKAVVAFVLAVVTALAVAVADGSIDWQEAVGIVGAAITAYGVFKKRNATAPETST